MSSLMNAIPRKVHKERAQLQSRKRFGLLEKHKDYVVHAKAYHKKEETLRGLKEKAAFRNRDEFYIKMIKTKIVDGVHRLESEANKYTQEELMLMKTQDIGYVFQKLQCEKYENDRFYKIEKLTTMLHSLDNNPSNKHVYSAEDREEAKQIKSQSGRKDMVPASEDIPGHIKRKTAASYRGLEGRRKRVEELEKLFMDMALQKELQNRKRVRNATSKPVYKWRSERKH